MAKINWVFQNEVGTNLNRYIATNVATGEEVAFDLLRGGNISIVGTPLNAENLNSLINAINDLYDNYLPTSGGTINGKIYFGNLTGIEHTELMSSFGFNEESVPCIVNEQGRYIGIATDELKGNYIYYFFPEKEGTIALLDDVYKKTQISVEYVRVNASRSNIVWVDIQDNDYFEIEMVSYDGSSNEFRVYNYNNEIEYM